MVLLLGLIVVSFALANGVAAKSNGSVPFVPTMFEVCRYK